MLGDLIIEESGDTVVRRVLPSQGGPQVEITFQAQGKVLGVEYQNMRAYLAVMRPDGLLEGGGQGIVMTVNGEAITWKGQGVGRMTPAGGQSYRGSLTFQTASEKLGRLNGIAGVFEYEVDASGKTTGKIWEWK